MHKLHKDAMINSNKLVESYKLKNEAFIDKDLLPKGSWENDPPELVKLTEYVIINHVHYDITNNELWINDYFCYKQVPHQLILMDLDGKNPIMSYLLKFDKDIPLKRYTHPMDTDCPVLNLKYMDYLFSKSFELYEAVCTINGVPLEAFKNPTGD